MVQVVECPELKSQFCPTPKMKIQFSYEQQKTQNNNT
jgi:hypothetical protein